MLLHSLLDLVLAPVCLGCGGVIRPGDTARLVCRRCRARLHPLPPPCCDRCGAPLLATGRTAGRVCDECRDWPLELVQARSACVLAPPADRLVHQLKYRGWRALGGVLGQLASPLAAPFDSAHEPALVVPVPTTGARLRARGYNQAALIAEALARHSHRECVQLLRRGAARSTQTTLQPLARRANVAGAFTVPESAAARLWGSHVILVDDVLTTGATAAECARTLAQAGACCVRLVTFARALDARRLINTET